MQKRQIPVRTLSAPLRPLNNVTGAAIAVVPESATAVRAPGVAFTPLRDMAPVEVICAYPVDGHSPTLNLFIEFVQSEISPSIRAEHELWPVEQSA